jgi:peptidoglycan/xylan/chitin deacetylase (PgdA/CDA1 family)
MQVTVTFDNGPTPGVTDAVLDVLADRGVPATFFVVGERLLDPSARALA